MSFFKSLPFFLLLSIGFQVFSQENKSIQGQILDAANLQPLVGASVYWEGQSQQGTISDLDGIFNLSVPALPAKITVRTNSNKYKPILTLIKVVLNTM